MNTIYTCRICNHTGNARSYLVREMMFGSRDPFVYFQCQRCQCLQIAEIPSDSDTYYPQDYYSFSETSRDRNRTSAVRWFRRVRNYYSVCNRGILGQVFSRLFPNRKLTSLAKVSLNPESRILDVGCGSGWRLYALREAGFINTLGIDPFIKNDIVHENGLRILKRTVLEMDGFWDLVMYHHSFEHIPEQAATLRATARLLRPGGVSLIRIPTVSSYAWEEYREHWYQIDAPRHYYLHSVDSMRLLAEQCGLALQEVVYDSTIDQFRASEMYKMGVQSVQEAGFSKAQVREWKRRAKDLNRDGKGDQAIFYLVASGNPQ